MNEITHDGGTVSIERVNEDGLSNGTATGVRAVYQYPGGDETRTAYGQTVDHALRVLAERLEALRESETQDVQSIRVANSPLAIGMIENDGNE